MNAMQNTNGHLLPLASERTTPAARIVEEGKAPVQETGSTHTSSPELRRYLALLRQTPQTRTNLVEQVAQRLASGHYLTAEAAYQTADAMVKSAE
jgi:hypothetical protein